jgi:hypothetical protein
VNTNSIRQIAIVPIAVAACTSEPVDYAAFGFEGCLGEMVRVSGDQAVRWETERRDVAGLPVTRRAFGDRERSQLFEEVHYTYDSGELVLEETDTDGDGLIEYRREWSFDAGGLLLLHTVSHVVQEAESLVFQLEYFYDGRQLVREELDQDGDGSLDGIRDLLWTDGRVTERISTNPSAPDDPAWVTTWTYLDAAPALDHLEITAVVGEPPHATALRLHDKEGRVIQEEGQSGGDEWSDSFAWNDDDLLVATLSRHLEVVTSEHRTYTPAGFPRLTTTDIDYDDDGSPENVSTERWEWTCP